MRTTFKTHFKKNNKNIIYFVMYPICLDQDIAMLDKLIKEDVDAGKLPLVLIANAGKRNVHTACSILTFGTLTAVMKISHSDQLLTNSDFCPQAPLRQDIQTS